MGRRLREHEAKYCQKHKMMACGCGADIYKRIFGPTLDESLFVLILAVLDIMELWKRSARDEETSEDFNEGWDEFTETSVTPLVADEEDYREEATHTRPNVKKKKLKHRC